MRKEGITKSRYQRCVQRIWYRRRRWQTSRDLVKARAADMKADTKVKQELLSELDEMKMDKGPRFFQEEFMGF